jgi:hypothetical protein
MYYIKTQQDAATCRVLFLLFLLYLVILALVALLRKVDVLWVVLAGTAYSIIFCR